MIWYDGALAPHETTTTWSEDFVTYDYIHVPYTTYPRSTDYLIDLPLFRDHCPVPWALGETGCPVRTAFRGTTASFMDALPNLVFGAELQHITLEPGGPAKTATPQESAVAAAVALAGHSGRPISEASPMLPSKGTDSLVASPAWQMRDDETFPSPGFAAASTEGSREETSLLLFLAIGVALPVVAYLLFHRIIGARVTDHPNRRAIQAFVAHHPGSDVAAIAAHLAVDYKTTLHHLAVLRRAKLIRVSRLGRRRTAVYAEGSQEEALQAAATRHETRQRIVWVVTTEPGLRQAVIARRLGVSKSTLHAHVATLELAGLVRNERGRVHLAGSMASPPAT